MKRTIVIAVWLLSVALPASLMAKQKAALVDMKGMNRVFLGWVDISPDDYHHQGYSSREQYLAVINHANTAFQETCQSKALSGRTMTAAKSRDDESTAGNDLYVKFSDVAYDHKYRLHLSVHFIDLKTNTEVGSIPLRIYKAHLCGLEGCMIKELDQVSEELQKEFAGGK
ncbi:MAG: hypothetical protein WCA49_05000 [Candidatus Sulfotelmatobacter sp.]